MTQSEEEIWGMVRAVDGMRIERARVLALIESELTKTSEWSNSRILLSRLWTLVAEGAAA